MRGRKRDREKVEVEDYYCTVIFAFLSLSLSLSPMQLTFGTVHNYSSPMVAVSARGLKVTGYISPNAPTTWEETHKTVLAALLLNKLFFVTTNTRLVFSLTVQLVTVSVSLSLFLSQSALLLSHFKEELVMMLVVIIERAKVGRNFTRYPQIQTDHLPWTFSIAFLYLSLSLCYELFLFFIPSPLISLLALSPVPIFAQSLIIKLHVTKRSSYIYFERLQKLYHSNSWNDSISAFNSLNGIYLSKLSDRQASFFLINLLVVSFKHSFYLSKESNNNNNNNDNIVE